MKFQRFLYALNQAIHETPDAGLPAIESARLGDPWSSERMERLATAAELERVLGVR